MVTIIRVEHPNDGKGIWRSVGNNEVVDATLNVFGEYNAICGLSNFEEFRDRHMQFDNPYEDEYLRGIEKDEFCAFKTIKQFQKWVEKSEIAELITQLGFKVLLLDVSECRVGKFQNVYKKENVLQTKDISNLFI